MTRKLFTIIALMTLALSACGGGEAPETPTAAATDTQIPTVAVATTAAPAMTETSTPDGTAVTFTPTVGTVGPTNPPDCTNSATFVTDITIPDDTAVAAGTVFTKTWRIANTGTCVWGPDYKLTYYSEERMNALDVPLDITYPGQNVDISINLTAPNSTGKRQANFVIKNSAGAIVKVGDDSRLWVVINVTTDGSAPTLTPAATSTSAAGMTSAPATATGAAATAISTIPAATTSGSNSSAAACLTSIDRAKLMETINAVNAYRAKKGLAAFRVDPKLAQAAQKHATDMACNKLTSHTGSDNSTPQTRVTATGYVASSVAENIYNSNPPFTGEGVVNAWVTDTANTTNNQNLLSSSFTEIGVGYSLFNGSGYYVLVFAKR
ncbi:MAG TPA: CAP domain-containing protein [Anaerolineales bacterium]|nr:CAP domain-containing protein [Anaerolineales bacterium]